MSDILSHRTLRLRFAVLGQMAKCHPPALLNALTKVFVDAKIPLAMGQEKKPRPIAQLAYPLPQGAESLEEWADITLASGIAQSMSELIDRLKPHCPPGLEFLGIEQIPLHASPVSELCEAAHWLWFCPPEMLAKAKAKIEEFANSENFQISKVGKVDGQKIEKSIEVRHLVFDLAWESGALRFSTKIIQGQALNPQKIIAGIMGAMGQDTEQLGKFQRQSLTLGQDPKLNRHDKYATKLRNLYEDAVLLESGPNVTISDDDEDGVLYLGGAGSD
jgi:radical SAM-linked protein